MGAGQGAGEHESSRCAYMSGCMGVRAGDARGVCLGSGPAFGEWGGSASEVGVSVGVCSGLGGLQCLWAGTWVGCL